MLFRREKNEKVPENTGARGEQLAAVHLRKHGYKIIGRNVRPIGHEELDIICETRTVRAFVEVKTRSVSPDGPLKYGTPAMAVTQEKRRHLISAARAYHAEHPTKKMLRMDVMEVYLPAGGAPVLHHIEDAFRS